MLWTTLILAGLVTFFIRFSMIALLKKNYFSPRVKLVLSYVPSAVFPAIIFPAIFLNSTGQLVSLDNPKVLAAFIAVLVGYLTESVIATILSGLAVLWLLIFFI
jgi:branched-subunit amino acid transport protein